MQFDVIIPLEGAICPSLTRPVVGAKSVVCPRIVLPEN